VGNQVSGKLGVWLYIEPLAFSLEWIPALNRRKNGQGRKVGTGKIKITRLLEEEDAVDLADKSKRY
jgi:hypothetical protein